MKLFFILLALISVTKGEDVHVDDIPAPPQPYNFVYTAGRAPGHTDRVHAESSDGSGVIRGMFSYVDPRHQIRTVEYVADQNGFHPFVVNPIQDTRAVSEAKLKHAALYQRIAEEQARLAAERGVDGDDGSYKEPQYYQHVEVDHPRDTPVVEHAKLKHAELYNKIAEQHHRLAVERKLNEPEHDIYDN